MNEQARPTYAAFWLFKAQSRWLDVDMAKRSAVREEFASVVQRERSGLTLRGAYSLAGFRADADLMFWLHGPEFADLQSLAAALRRTALGQYLDWAYVYTGTAMPAQYDPAHSAAFLQGAPPKRYLSVYPFVKTAEWYLLPFEDRRALMAEHGRIGRRFAVPREQLATYQGEGGRGTATAVAATVEETGGGVLTNTIHSFGLGDQEFVVAFESDDAYEMVKMVETLRATEVRRYTKIDTPIFLGMWKPLGEALADMG